MFPAAWLNFRLSPMVQQRIGSSNAEVPNWELRSGVYYGEPRLSGLDGSHDDNLLAGHTQTAVLGSSNIPSPTNYEKKFSFCTADPKQGLVVLVEERPGFARFHFRLLTTGQPHPLAKHTIISVCFDSTFPHENNLSDELMSADPEIVGNCFMAKIDRRESDSNISEILVWDWRVGALLARVDSQYSSASCTFLDKEHLLVYSVLPENSIQSTRLALFIYRIPKIPQDYIVPPNANFCPSLYPEHSPTVIFEFPELHPSWTLAGHGLIMGWDPLPGDVVYTKSATLLCSHVTALGFDLRICNNPRRQPDAYRSHKGVYTNFQVFVSTHHLLMHLKCQLEGITTPTRTICWSHWGTSATRWFIEDDLMEHFTDRIYGSQYIRTTATDSGESQLVSIVDFNPPMIKRHAYITAAAAPRAKCTSSYKAENTAVLEGKGMTTGRLFQTSIASTKLPVPILVSIVDFNPPMIKRHAYITAAAAPRAKCTSSYKAENTAVLEGKGMTTGRLFQTSIASTKLPVPIVGEALNQEVLTEMIGSEMKTIIRVGFKDPVVSCLPYRVVTKVQLLPLHGHWRIHGEYLVGIPRLDWRRTDNPCLSLYKLELPSQD
ncbi:unnamed protein product [Rhizoctonia solani]|uniref:Uncharacterized protein n=1 Tax=Rhizoctonia solani TaxID=456999 RepID=A0A8H3H1T0_9AGAM|nr:unnamed protein product [Rhizoctonia solani]